METIVGKDKKMIACASFNPALSQDTDATHVDRGLLGKMESVLGLILWA